MDCQTCCKLICLRLLDDVEDQSTYGEQHRAEQTEAAVCQACDILDKHSENYVLYVRTAPNKYARRIAGVTCVERIAIASGVLADLNLIVSDIAIVAAKEADDFGGDLDPGNIIK